MLHQSIPCGGQIENLSGKEVKSSVQNPLCHQLKQSHMKVLWGKRWGLELSAEPSIDKQCARSLASIWPTPGRLIPWQIRVMLRRHSTNKTHLQAVRWMVTNINEAGFHLAFHRSQCGAGGNQHQWSWSLFSQLSMQSEKYPNKTHWQCAAGGDQHQWGWSQFRQLSTQSGRCPNKTHWQCAAGWWPTPMRLSPLSSPHRVGRVQTKPTECVAGWWPTSTRLVST